MLAFCDIGPSCDDIIVPPLIFTASECFLVSILVLRTQHLLVFEDNHRVRVKARPQPIDMNNFSNDETSRLSTMRANMAR